MDIEKNDGPRAQEIRPAHRLQVSATARKLKLVNKPEKVNINVCATCCAQSTSLNVKCSTGQVDSVATEKQSKESNKGWAREVYTLYKYDVSPQVA